MLILVAYYRAGGDHRGSVGTFLAHVSGVVVASSRRLVRRKANFVAASITRGAAAADRTSTPAVCDGLADACGQLWTLVREYLLTVAKRELPTDRVRRWGSDLVQETLIDAQRNIARFEGRTQAELLAWLRRILLNHISDANRQLAGRRRNRSRELSLNGGSSIIGPQPPAANGDSPSRMAMAGEEAHLIEQASAQLPPDYRQATRLRSWDFRMFADIGQCLGCSPDAGRKLWLRAIERFERLWLPAARGVTVDHRHSTTRHLLGKEPQEEPTDEQIVCAARGV